MEKPYVRILVWSLMIVLLAGLSTIGSRAQSGRNRNKPKSSSSSSSSSSSTTSSGNSSRPDDSLFDESTPAESGNKDAGKEAGKEPPIKIERANPNEVDDLGPALTIDATLVTVPVIVSDRSGRYVPFLKQSDFKLAEDSVAQDISFFTSERAPFNLALVMDTSGSIEASMPEIQESGVRFLRELRDEDQIMVVEFNSRVNVLNELTTDHNKIRHSIETTRAGGGTRLYDALYTAANRLKEVEGRKAIILLTDGEDTESRNASERDAIEAVLESGALMYVIQFPATAGANSSPTFGIPPTFPGAGGGRRNGTGQYPDPAFLHELVRNTGGDMYYAGGRNGLPNVWRKIAEDLRYVYVLGYYPTNPLENGGFRHIRVQLAQRDVGAIRYKQGYSANKSKNKKDKKDKDKQKQAKSN